MLDEDVVNQQEDPRPGGGRMFDGIAARYDLLNRIMSLGIDIRWRKRAVRALALGEAETPRVLDVATGTADIALEVAKTWGARVVGVDPSEGMMDVGRDKVAAAGLADQIALEVGDAQNLRFEDDAFDGAIISFGIRNVPDRNRGLAEMTRVTRPGGRVVVLEANEPDKGLMAAGARFHMHHVIPFVGGLLSNSRDYRYLQTSIKAFPQPDEFAAMMEQAGLHEVTIDPRTFGVVTIFSGRVR